MGTIDRTAGAMRIGEIVMLARDLRASDVHLAEGRAPAFRIDGRLVTGAERAVQAGDIEAFLEDSFGPDSLAVLGRRGVHDAARRDEILGALRTHAFHALGGMRCAIRLLPPHVPALASLDVPQVLEELPARTGGLVLIAGPAGSGKTTLLAALIDSLNRKHPRHVVTLEDPVEFVHQPQRCVIAQCEAGEREGALPVAAAIEAVLRADPDVVAIGELRERDAIRSALTAADTGHLVIASIHALDAPGAIDRVIDAFPIDGRDQVRVQLAQTLAAVIGLRLVAKARGPGRRAAVEILIGTDAVRNIVREGKTHQLRSAMQTGRTHGMQTLEMHLRELIERGEIAFEGAREAAVRPEDIQPATGERG